MTAQELVLTVEDANQRLPLVRVIVRDAMALSVDVRARQDRLLELRERYPAEDDDASPYSEEVLQMEESVEDDECRIDGFAAELQQVGAELIDAETGLVEFVSVVNGLPARLSWMPDEQEVGYWRLEGDVPGERKSLQLIQDDAHQLG